MRPDEPAFSKLSDYGRDVSAQAEAGDLDPVLGRDAEVDQILRILASPGKNSVVLLGPGGVGKTRVVEGLAIRLSSGNMGKALVGRRVFELDVNSLVAGTVWAGSAEERVKQLLGVMVSERYLLFIDEIHSLFSDNVREWINLPDVLKPSLASGELTVIGVSTPEEYDRSFGQDSALSRRFQRVQIKEPSREIAIKIVRAYARQLERDGSLPISLEAIEVAVDLTVRNQPDRRLPDKALDLLKYTAGKKTAELPADTSGPWTERLSRLIRILRDELQAIESTDMPRLSDCLDDWDRYRMGPRARRVTANDIQSALGERLGVPISGDATGPSERVGVLRGALEQGLIGQRRAVKALDMALKRMAQGLKPPGVPIGAFLFLGPTGTGKTEAARIVARTLFGSASAMVRIDMSEFAEPASVNKLIGSPPGYVGHEDGGRLTTAISARPYSLILFDEVEKAHPSIHRIFLSLFEEGRLTDGRGRTVDATRCLFVLTSNVGANLVATRTPDEVEENYDALKKSVEEVLRTNFADEIFNRLDDVVLFSPHGPDELSAILNLIVESQAGIVEAQTGHKLTVTSSARQFILDSGLDLTLGARPVKRAFQNLVLDPLAQRMSDGLIERGRVVRVDVLAGQISIQQ